MKSNRSPITTHVLDLSRGRPASGIPVHLEKRGASEDDWTSLKRAVTDADGRVGDLLEPGSKAEVGVYRLTFVTAGVSPFYPSVSVLFELKAPDEHYHVPLLLSPFGYSTYRGS